MRTVFMFAILGASMAWPASAEALVPPRNVRIVATSPIYEPLIGGVQFVRIRVAWSPSSLGPQVGLRGYRVEWQHHTMFTGSASSATETDTGTLFAEFWVYGDVASSDDDGVRVNGTVSVRDIRCAGRRCSEKQYGPASTPIPLD